jgi:hypothetical protein
MIFPDEIAIRINGKIFRGWTVTSIERSINSIADSFSFTAPFNPDDPDSVYLDPFTYLETESVRRLESNIKFRFNNDKYNMSQ